MDWLILRLAREDGTDPVRVESIMACWIEDKTRGALVVFGPCNLYVLWQCSLMQFWKEQLFFIRRFWAALPLKSCAEALGSKPKSLAPLAGPAEDLHSLRPCASTRPRLALNSS